MSNETICVFNVVVRCEPKKNNYEEFNITKYLRDMDKRLPSVDIIDVVVNVVGKYSKYRLPGEGEE